MSRRHQVLAASAAVAALVAARGAPPASADADPASDILLTQNVFLPYAPTVSPGLAKALTTLTGETERAGFPIKVAVIASATDLGGVSGLYGQPARYAPFLASEISFNRKQLVLVVMAAGLGTANVPDPGALNGLQVDSSHGSDGLTRTAITAVVRLANGAGHAVRAPHVSGGSSSSGVSPLIAFGAPVALVILAALLAGLARRQRPAEPAEGEEGGDGAAGPA
jgi:hypothetical protein